MFSKHSSSRLVECVLVYILTLSSLSLVSVNGEEPTDEPIPEGSPNRLPTTNLPSPSSRISNNSIGITSLEMKSRRSTPVHHTSSSELQTAGLVSSQTPMQTTGLVSSQTPVVETSYLHISISSGVNSSSRTEAAVYSTFSALSQTWADQTRHLRTIVSSASSQTSSLFPVHRSPTSSLSLSNVVVSSSLHPSSSAARSHTSSLVRISASTPGSTNVITPTVSGSTIVQSGLVGSASLQFSTSVSGVFASRTVLVSQLSSRTTRSTAMMPQSVHSSPLIQPSSTVQPLPPTSPPPPDPPIIQEVTALSANSVYLKWNVSSGQVTTNFTVEFGVNLTTWVKADCNHSLVEEACVVTQRNAVVVGLQPFTNYTFRVVARSQFGSSNGSIATEWVTTKEGVPSQPNQVAVKALNSTAMFLNWTEPTEINGLLVKYEVNYSEKGSLEAVVIDAGLRKSQLLSPLKPYTVYVISIRAFTWEGGGRPVTVMEQTNESPPSGPPQNVKAITISSSSIILYCSPPIESQQNGKITQYNITITSVLEQTRTVRTNDNSTKIPISDLEAYTNYSFVVQAINVAGVGPYSSLVSNVTFEAEPSPPRNVTAQSVNSTAVQVSWVKAMHPNGIIHYRLYERLSKDAEASNHLVYNGTNTEFVVSQLEEFITYTFTVESLNLKYKWTSTPAIATETTHPAEPTGPPQNARAVTLSSTSIRVTWEPPLQSEQNGIIIKYTVWYTTQSSGETKSLVTPDNRTSAEVKNLTGFTTYAFAVMAWNSVGSGSKSESVYNTTFEGIPSPPRNMVAKTINSTAVKVTWNSSQYPNGEIEYRLYYWQSSEGPSAKKQAYDGPALESIVTGLYEYVAYTFMLLAYNAKYSWSSSAVNATVTTHPAEPSSPPRNVVALTNSSTRVVVKWIPPKEQDRNGIITNYIVNYNLTSGGPEVSLNSTGNNTYKLVTNLGKYTVYNFTVQAVNKVGVGPASSPVSNRTFEDLPSDAPRNVTVVSTSSTSVTLSWEPPLEPNGEIVGYDVAYYESDDSNNTNIRDNIKDKVHTLTGLKPWSTYYIAVACESSKGIGPYSESIIQRTDAGDPPPIGTLAPPEKQKVTSTTFEVQLTKASNENGEVSYYQVIVRELAKDNRGSPVPPNEPRHYKAADLYTYDEARRLKPKLVPYIAFQFSASDFDEFKSFTVGDEKGSHDSMVTRSFVRRRRANRASVFYNGPLEEQTFYTVFQRAYVNKDVYSSSHWIDPVETGAASSPLVPGTHSTDVGLIVGLVVAILVVLVLVLIGTFYIRKKRLDFGTPLDDREEYSNGQPMKMKTARNKRRSLQKRLMGSTDSLEGLDELAASRARRQPVPIDDFERHVDRMHMDGDHGFSEEYSLVQPDDEFSYQQFLNPANKYKNRYANIVAYDHTRVLLNQIEGVAGSDYINANFIDGYNRPRGYIAAQGPLMETFDDFWRMMWEQNSLVIVMLTKLEERGRRKCDQYWPERGTRTYGHVQVTLTATLNMSYYTVRKMTVTHKLFPDEERSIKQFHFTAWPDHGVPSHPTPLLSLVRHVSTSNRDAYGPMVVHCSAGVGRTGTFITLDVMLQKISEEDCIDVFGFVRQMRYQRNYMVQTEAQYVFIHDALLEAITCGVTEVEAKDLGARLRELRQVDSETGYTYLENEFCRLAKEENHPIAFKSASLNCNALKNRYANILPFESTRVHLKMRPGEMGSDYINANYIDGYCQPKAYIATQAPVPDTFEDFWRLIWEHESAAVVMLTMEEEKGKVKCHHYWPSEGSRLYGVILVELAEEDSYSDYVTRKFKLTHTEEKDTRTVRQFQYTDWPDTGLPDSGVGIIDLIGQVQKWQQQSGNTAIVIHCSGGVGRTGVFCAISIMIERLKAEGVVDVFQTVQAMRLQRPAMVQTAEQYEFCYTTLQEYLDSFDLYANFQ